MRQLFVLSTLAASGLKRSLVSRTAAAQLRHYSAVGYVTDIEGNLDYWQKYLQVSKVLRKDSVGKIELKDDCQFVYGGDVCDRGSGCLRVMSDLIGLKEKYPERVHLVLGNRDINKLRIQTSMHPSVLRCYPHTYWTKTSVPELVASGYQLNDPEAKMKWILAKSMGAPLAYAYRQQELLDMHPQHRALSAAPWRSFLDMSDPQRGLLTRYLELGQIAARIGDTLFVHGAVHEHSMGWVPPLRRGLGGEGAASSVGAASMQGLQGDSAVPPLLRAGRRVDTLQEWVESINTFVRAEVADYRQHTAAYLASLNGDASAGPVSIPKDTLRSVAGPMSAAAHTAIKDEAGEGGIAAGDRIWDSVGGYEHPQPGSRLLQYGMGRLADGTLNPSVIYSSYLKQRHVQHGHVASTTGATSGTAVPASTVPAVATTAAPMSAQTALWLRQGGVNKVVVGHQPVGDAPLYMEAHGVQMFSVDTSYSRNVQWPTQQLQELSSTSTSTSAQPSATGSTNSSGSTQCVEAWTTYASFMQPAAVPVGQAGGCAVHAAPVLPNPTTTRAPQAGFEVLFRSPEPGEGTSTPSHHSSVCVTGYLSSGYYLDCTYPPLALTRGTGTATTAYSDSDVLADPYVGRTTATGWTVRASGVRPHITSNAYADTGTICSDAQQRLQDDGKDGSSPCVDRDANTQDESYYLLSSVEGFTFRNRLVRASAIAEEFAAE